MLPREHEEQEVVRFTIIIKVQSQDTKSASSYQDLLIPESVSLQFVLQRTTTEAMIYGFHVKHNNQLILLQ